MSVYSEQALAGRTALVIGAAQGIGAAVAAAFRQAGARVIGADLNAGGDIEKVDVTDEDSIIALMGKVGPRLDALVYGAAHLDPASQVPELAPAMWRKVLDVNLTGAFLACKHAIPLMRDDGGSIVLIASQLGSVGSPGRAAYCATKGALIQLAKVLAIDHAADGIRANTLSPGAVATQRLTFRYGSVEAAEAEIGPKHLLGRLGAPAELASAAVFLASDASSFMTGADLLVDGGYNAV
jgi:NAD(P)-dependent dehydrogenase (short-subunit alcohol dehydrogenase family)